jgi:hypothetical protein
MRIRPGGPGDIATVLALGDETVKWMNARGNIQQWGTAPWTGNQMREAAIRDQEFTVALPAGEWPGMLLAMRLAQQ